MSPTNNTNHLISSPPYRVNSNMTDVNTCNAKCVRITLGVIIPIFSLCLLAVLYLVFRNARRTRQEQQAQQVGNHVREELGKIGQSTPNLRPENWEEVTLNGSTMNEVGKSGTVSDASSLSGRSGIISMDDREIGVARSEGIGPGYGIAR